MTILSFFTVSQTTKLNQIMFVCPLSLEPYQSYREIYTRILGAIQLSIRLLGCFKDQYIIKMKTQFRLFDIRSLQNQMIMHALDVKWIFTHIFYTFCDYIRSHFAFEVKTFRHFLKIKYVCLESKYRRDLVHRRFVVCIELRTSG